MKYLLFSVLLFISSELFCQNFIKDTLHLKVEDKEYHYIIGETSAAEIMADFPELKFKVTKKKDKVRHSNWKVVRVSLKDKKNQIHFSFQPISEKKERESTGVMLTRRHHYS